MVCKYGNSVYDLSSTGFLGMFHVLCGDRFQMGTCFPGVGIVNWHLISPWPQAILKFYFSSFRLASTLFDRSWKLPDSRLST